MKKTKKQLIQETLRHIIELFRSGNVPQAIAIATFPKFDIPSNNWSLANRILMNLNGTEDARTYKQWQYAKRMVGKGQKAFHIFAPRKIKVTKEDEDGNKTDLYIVKGFLPIPVFRLEQTEGKDLDYQKIELPSFPLIDKAKEWNIDVSAVGFNDNSYGYYSFDGQQEKIRLASPHEIVFFHELSHSSHRRVLGKLKNIQDPEQEIVAELSAQVIAQLVGTKIESSLGNSYEYISSYAKRIGKEVGIACLSVLSQVEKVLYEIFEASTYKKEKDYEKSRCP